MLTPDLKTNLCYHLQYLRSPENAPYMGIGTENQLKTLVKIKESDTLKKLFDSKGFLGAYPKLPPKESLVACFSGPDFVSVIAVYTLKHIQEAQKLVGNNGITHLKWAVMEIPESLEKELNEINLLEYELSQALKQAEKEGGSIYILSNFDLNP